MNTTRRGAEIERILEQRVQSLPPGPLPSIARLAAEYHVSYVTMWKAVRRLADRGIVECRRGARTMAAGARMAGAQDRLVDLLRARILEGAWKTGEQTPKFSYFESLYHISTDTITGALQTLAAEGMVHKKGKRWIVGPGIRLAGRKAAATDQPAVLIAVPYLGNLRGLFEFSFNARFMIPFSEELMRAGMRQHFVQMHTIDPAQTQQRAIRDADALLRRLGDRYLGAFVHRGPYRFDEYHENMDAWIDFLAMRGKPAVFFDANGTNGIFSRARYGKYAGYHRLYFDEHAGVRCALDALTEAGHRRIGFPVPSEEASEWISLRAKMAQTISRESAAPAEIISIAQREGIWNVSTFDTYDSMYAKIAASRTGRQSRPRLQSSHRGLIANTPSFRTLLEKQVTAIIAPNDAYALAYYQWFLEAGIDIPRHLSMVSFDNAPEAAPFPISSVDFGFGRLGYQAAHILIGDIPVKADKEGNLPGACSLTDRGSIGPPRNAGLKI